MKQTRPQRRSIRLPEWDYACEAAYHIILVTEARLCIFGDVVDDAVILSPCGQIIQDEWLASATIRREIRLDTHIVMPNHLHGIVWIQGPPPTEKPAQRPARGPTPKSLASLVGGFKSATTRRIRALLQMPETAVWQRNYYERVIRDERELVATRQYILDNPARWAEDEEHPQYTGARSW
jgi:putative transposase